MPAKSMVLVRNNRELWVGCGNKIVIVDTSTLVILDDIFVYQTQRTHVRIMVTNGERVWSGDRRSTKILQWEVSTRQLTHIFDCDVDNPVGQVLCTEVTEQRRFSGKGGSMNRARNRAISDPPSVGEPSYTESMFKEAIARGKNEEGHKSESLRRDITPPSTAIPENSGLEDLDSSVKTESSAVIIPGSQAKSFNGNEQEKNSPSRFRSLSSETDSGGSTDSGVSSFRGTCTTVSTVPGTGHFQTAASPDHDQDAASKIFENVFSEAGKAVHLDGNQNKAEQDFKGSDEIHSKDEKDQVSPAFASDESKPSETDIANFEIKASVDEAVDRTNTQQGATEVDDVVTSDDKQQDANRDLNKNEPEFELVDKDETRKAFIEGTRKNPVAENAAVQQCPSMNTLQVRFISSGRAPSLMSSQRRKSQRRQTNEGNEKSPPTASKPWAGRPRLRILAGSINRVTSLLLVSGSLWVGRGVGDVLTMNVNSANNDLPHGHVFAQLESDNLLGYENGQVDEIINNGTNKVVCLRRLEPARGSQNEERFTERYQLVVWEAWGDTEFIKFKDRLDHFNSLVD